MIRMACPRCKSPQEFGDDCAGKTVPCPKCRQPVAVPPVVPVAVAAPVRAVPAPQQPVSYTVPVQRQAPEFVVPEGARMNPLLLVGAGVALLLLGGLYLMTFLPEKKEHVSPGTPPPTPVKRKDLPLTRDPVEVVKDLKSEDPGIVFQAVQELDTRVVGGKPALNLLSGIIKDRSKADNVHLKSRRVAAVALGKIGAQEDEEVRQNLAGTLQVALNDPDEELRYAAMTGLGKLGKPGAQSLLPVLDRFAVDKRSAMRAGEVLATMGADAQPAIPVFQRMMQGTQIHDGVKLCSYIVQIDPRGPGTGGQLNAALRYNDEGVRRHALVLIGQMGNSARGLAPTLDYVASNDINAELREMARKALDKMNQN